MLDSSFSIKSHSKAGQRRVRAEAEAERHKSHPNSDASRASKAQQSSKSTLSDLFRLPNTHILSVSLDFLTSLLSHSVHPNRFGTAPNEAKLSAAQLSSTQSHGLGRLQQEQPPLASGTELLFSITITLALFLFLDLALSLSLSLLYLYTVSIRKADNPRLDTVIPSAQSSRSKLLLATRSAPLSSALQRTCSTQQLANHPPSKHYRKRVIKQSLQFRITGNDHATYLLTFARQNTKKRVQLHLRTYSPQSLRIDIPELFCSSLPQ